MCLSYFCMTKSTKSHLRGFSILLKIFFRVHELVAGSSAWRVRAAKGKEENSSVALSVTSTIPRVRTYHTRKPSRFVHALSARPLKKTGGRGWSKCADGTKSYFLFCLFAVLRLYLVGVGAVDDPRGMGINTYAKHVCRRRRDGSQFFPLFVLFVLFGQAKRALKEKNHNVTFPLSYFWSCKSTIKETPHILTKSGFRAWYTAISRKPTAFSISFAVPKSAARSRAQCASEPRVIISPPSSR